MGQLVAFEGPCHYSSMTVSRPTSKPNHGLLALTAFVWMGVLAFLGRWFWTYRAGELEAGAGTSMSTLGTLFVIMLALAAVGLLRAVRHWSQRGPGKLGWDVTWFVLGVVTNFDFNGCLAPTMCRTMLSGWRSRGSQADRHCRIACINFCNLETAFGQTRSFTFLAFGCPYGVQYDSSDCTYWGKQYTAHDCHDAPTGSISTPISAANVSTNKETNNQSRLDHSRHVFSPNVYRLTNGLAGQSWDLVTDRIESVIDSVAEIPLSAFNYH